MSINIDECRAAGFNDEQIKKIESIARRISKAAKEAEVMGIEIFGGSGTGTLRFNDDVDNPRSRNLILAVISGGFFDGGCGACDEDDEGLMRGE